MTTIYLKEEYFANKEQLLISANSLECHTFRYNSGVCGVRLKNKKGFIEVLPFQGQQVWKAVFNDRDLTMKSPIKEPIANVEFLKTYGAFMVHCGARRVGGPANGEIHPLHGDLPNAFYKKAWIVTGNDTKGNFIGISGEYEFCEFFSDHYLATPLLKLYQDSSVFDVTMNIENLNSTAMELMYLCHINFKPVDNSLIVYSTPYTSQYVKLRESIPTHIKVSDQYIAFLKELKDNPSLHHVLKPELRFDPEGVFYIHYLSDKEGFGHTMQVLPDGTSDYVKHNIYQLPKALRWISRTPNNDAIAIIEPATCEADGYVEEKKKGNIITLPGGKTFCCNISIGSLDIDQTKMMEQNIKEISSLK